MNVSNKRRAIVAVLKRSAITNSVAQAAYEHKGRTNSAGRASHDLAPSWRGYTTLVRRCYYDGTTIELRAYACVELVLRSPHALTAFHTI